MIRFNRVFQKINQLLSSSAQSFKCRVCGEYHQGVKAKMFVWIVIVKIIDK